MMMGRFDEAEATEILSGPLSYPLFKGMSGVAIAAVLGGRLARARELIDELLRLGKAAGNPRAEAIGYVAECAWRWAVLDDAAGDSAILGLEAARDDIYRASNAFPLALALVSNGRYADVRELTATWLPKMRANGNYWIAAVLEVMQCAADIALGRMSAGMRDLVRIEAELRARGYALPRVRCSSHDRPSPCPRRPARGRCEDELAPPQPLVRHPARDAGRPPGRAGARSRYDETPSPPGSTGSSA